MQEGRRSLNKHIHTLYIIQVLLSLLHYYYDVHVWCISQLNVFTLQYVLFTFSGSDQQIPGQR